MNTDLSNLLQVVSQLQPRTLEWLWAGRLALGKLAILDGDPGLGKSLVALDLCARLSTGRAFPDGSAGPGPCNCLILNGEDTPEDTILPRLEALGADLERVFILRRADLVTGEPLTFPLHTAVLDAALTQTQARLLVVDPLMAFLDRRVQSGNDASVRRALVPLAELAEKHRCAALFVRHLNKSRGWRSLYRGGGSIGFVGTCRSGWLVARDPHEPDRRVLVQVKNNVAPPQPSLAFAVQTQEGLPPTVTWLGPTTWTADQLLAGERTPPTIEPRDRARDFLATALRDGPLTSRELWTLAQKQRLAKRTLFRAKQELDIRIMRVSVDGKQLVYWLLPGQELPPSVPPEAIPPSLEEWLAPLRAKYPPATPLDEL